MDLASGESWRHLHDHPSTKAEELQNFLPIVEGRPFLEHHSDGSVKQGASMGSDGIAISSDVLVYIIARLAAVSFTAWILTH
jgi:hypothetical protein